MRSISFVLTAVLAGAALARSPRHVGRKDLPAAPRPRHGYPAQFGEMGNRTTEKEYLIPQNANTTKYAVNGSAIPDVDFDIGESYAGLMPIGGANSTKELYFWFFPTSNPNGTEDLTIWLNGGPGCSSLEGFFQENGPVLWQYGTFKPVKNYWTWVNLTNMVWVEQPVGTGFTQGEPTATSEEEVAQEFLGFFKNFIDTFGLQNKKIYVTGESYAGYYVPYIADAMFTEEDPEYFDVQGTMIYDPVIGQSELQSQITVVPYVDQWAGLFNFNSTFTDDIHRRHEECGYQEYIDTYFQYPPPGQFSAPPNQSAPGCDLWSDVFSAVSLTNPCFDIYQIATTCPLLWDVLGFPGSFDYLPEGASIYFNRTEVQKAINAPIQEWAECSNGVLDTDTSDVVSVSVYPRVIEKSKRTILGHGNLDYILLADGARLAIQNMTWGGKQGFESEPCSDFYVPYHEEASQATLAASGVMGITHTERGFTWVETFLSGHMVPQYQPSAAYRQLEFLLGRIESLEEVSDFTTQSGDFGNVESEDY